MGLYASTDYLARQGEPVPASGFAGHDLVMYEPYWRDRTVPTLVDEVIDQGRVVAAVNSSMMVRRAIAEGLGIGEIPIALGERDGLARVWPSRERSAPYEVWMVTHKDLRHTARVRLVIDQLVRTFEG